MKLTESLFRLGFTLLLIGQASCSTQKKADWATASGSSAQQGRAYAREAELSENQTWAHYLFLIGEKLGCYFTFECSVTSEPHRGLDMWVTNGGRVDSINTLLSKMVRELKGFRVIQNANDQRIIHIVEVDLEKYPRYVMNNAISLRYTGPLEGLPMAIQKAVGGITIKGFGSTQDEVQGDAVTKVSINVTNQTVREVLTRAIPLEKYKAKLWRAERFGGVLGDDLYVRFYGPKQREPGGGPTAPRTVPPARSPVSPSNLSEPKRTKVTEATVIGTWSEPVKGLRGRLLFGEDGKFNGTRIGVVYLELQNVRDSDLQAYYGAESALRWELLDESGTAVRQAGMRASIWPDPNRWLLLPPDSTLCFRVSTSGYGIPENGGLALAFVDADWVIPATARTGYFLSATFNAGLPPKDHRFMVNETSGFVYVKPSTSPEDPALSLHSGRIWRGTLNLPKIRIPTNTP